VLQLKLAGYLTTSDVARTLGIGVTTLRRREGTVYPRASRIGGIRVYRREEVERLQGSADATGGA
jgi:DNA-binding transcriptional MerR regulator